MEEFDVVIVGGGLAGLGAAKTLCDRGKFKVALLEANTIVGGRVRTDRLPDGTPIPLGATYFHGRKGNSLLDYAKAEGLVVANSEEVDIEDNSILHTFSQGKRVPKAIFEQLEKRYWEIYDGIFACHEKGDWSSFETVRNDNSSNSDNSKPPFLDVHDFIYSEMVPFLKERSADHLSHDVHAILEGYLATEGITEGTKGFRDVDLALFGAWLYLDEDIEVIFKDNPFHKIIGSLTSKIPVGTIKTVKEVCKIEWNNKQLANDKDQVIIVRCTDGSVYNAKHIIYTCSIGVLKCACANGVFTPPLPENKLVAIKEVGIGIINKVFLQFDAPLFPGNKYNQFQLYWRDEDKSDSIIASNQWVMGLNCIMILPNESDKFIYYAYFVGGDALMVEKLPEHEVGSVVMHAMHLFLAKPLPQLISIRVTSWGKSYTCGSYSYTPHGTSLDKREELGRPVHGCQILFAGEATSIDQFGCAHSAFDTGIREAHRLIDYYSGDC